MWPRKRRLGSGAERPSLLTGILYDGHGRRMSPSHATKGSTVWPCVTPKSCNKSAYEIDARGNRTDYDWSPTHGQLTSVTGPADAAGVRPQTTYGYTAFSGSDGATFYLLTSKVEKINSSASTTTTYSYDTANKFALTAAVVDSGGLALRTCFKVDAIGNLVSTSDARTVTCP